MTTHFGSGRRLRKLGLGLLLTTACAPGTADPPQVAFWNAIRALCGQAFEGRAVEVSSVDSAIVGQTLVLDVWQCYHDELRLAFHVGDDHSRVWRLLRDDESLRLVHDVHEADGSVAEISGYGGRAADPGSPTLQEFMADPETTTQVPSAAGSTWSLEILPRERLTYDFSGVGGIRFRVDFDLSARAGRPPPPWGLTRRRRP